MVGIYLSLSAAAVILTFTLLKEFDEKSLYNEPEINKEKPLVVLKKCARQLIRPYQLLWVPFCAQTGLTSSLILAEWNSVGIDYSAALE